MTIPAFIASPSFGRILPRLALGGFVLSLLLGALVPIYSDEILWRLHLRAAVDGGLDATYNDLCGPGTIAQAPWLMMPVRWFSATMNQAFADPLFVRLTGVSCALLLAGLLWLTIRRLAPDQSRRAFALALAFALLGLGYLPFVLVLSRPEQPIVLCFVVMMLAALGAAETRRRGAAVLAVAVIAVLTAIAVSYHVKGVLYVPVAVVCVWIAASGRALLPVRLAGLAAVLAAVLVAVPYWAGRFACPGDPVLAAKLAGENVAVSLIGQSHFANLLGQLASGANPLGYVMLIVPRPEMMASWLPPGLVSPGLSAALALVIGAVWLAALVLAALALISFVRRNRASALTEPRFLLALAILGCVFAWGCAQVNRNDYEAMHVLPMLAIFVVLAVTLPGTEEGRFARLLPRVALAAVPIALLSQALVLALTAGPLWRIAHEPGYIDAQPSSLSVVGYGQIRRDIHQAMAEAGIPTDRRLRHLLVDDMTYLALQGSYMPLHRVGVLSDFNGSIVNPAEYLVRRGSDGIVVGCRYLPLDLPAAQSGQICAVARKSLEEFAEAGAPAGDIPF